MTTLQEKESEIRNKMRQRREEFRIYMKIYKEMELKVDTITLDEGPKEKMKGQQKDAESPSFPFSIESKDMDQWAEREKLTPETVRVLKEEGFDSLEKLSELTSADIDTLFINTNLLIKQQCLRLKKAVERLNTESSQGQADSGHVKASAGQQRWSWEFEDQTLRFLLVGKTGSGKSSTGNTIFGEELFDSELNFASVTSECTLRCKEQNGTLIEVMDSPGLFDTKRKENEVEADFVQALACLHPGITAILYVIMLGTRFTEEDTKVYERLKALLDPRVTKYMIIIFTRGDYLNKKKKTIDEMLLQAPEGLRTVLRECDNRHVVFDNMADNKQSQVEQLLEVVHKMSQAHGGKPYTCPKYSEIGKKVEEEVARRMQEVEEKEVKATTYGRKLVTETKEAQKRLKRKKQEVEERQKQMQAQMQQMQEEIQKQREEFQRKEQEKEEQMMKKNKEMQLKLKQIEEEAEKFEKMEKEKEEQMKMKELEMQVNIKQMEEETKRQKKEFERKEKERIEQIRQNELVRQVMVRVEQIKIFKETLVKQQLSAERVEQMKKFRQETETAREKERKEMEQQRERERQGVENIQQQVEMTRRYEERLEDERQARKVREDQHQREMIKLEKERRYREDQYQIEMKKAEEERKDWEYQFQTQIQNMEKEKKERKDLYQEDMKNLTDKITDQKTKLESQRHEMELYQLSNSEMRKLRDEMAKSSCVVQ